MLVDLNLFKTSIKKFELIFAMQNQEMEMYSQELEETGLLHSIEELRLIVGRKGHQSD